MPLFNYKMTASCGCGFTEKGDNTELIMAKAVAHAGSTGHTLNFQGEIRVEKAQLRGGSYAQVISVGEGRYGW